jgi:hypothetical protein
LQDLFDSQWLIERVYSLQVSLFHLKQTQALSDFFCYKIAFQAAGADFKGNRGSPDFSLYLDEIRFPGAAAAVFGMAYRVSANRMFTANIASP